MLAPAVKRSTLFRSKLYCCSNKMTSLMKNASCFLKNVLLCKGYFKHFFRISHMDLIDSVFGIYFFLQVKYCSWVFKTNMEFSLAPNSAIADDISMNKNENHTGNYLHKNKEHQNRWWTFIFPRYSTSDILLCIIMYYMILVLVV